MRYDDRIRIETPEGIGLELALGGLGSRMAAAFVDGLIQMGLMIALALLLGLPLLASQTMRRFAPWAVALGILGYFAIHFGYHVLFETLRGGRTPGKRLMQLRVVRASGGPVTLRDSAIRNLLRLVDQDLTNGVVGVVSILVSKRNQRLGDIAAGTIVVRDHGTGADQPQLLFDARLDVDSWDVTGVTDEELSTVRVFLARRGQIDGVARSRLAWDLAERLRPRVVGAPERLAPEEFLAGVAAALSRRGE